MSGVRNNDPLPQAPFRRRRNRRRNPPPTGRAHDRRNRRATAAAGVSTLTASIQVAPQAHDVAPNVNSLAVEIAAKSQSGAKQFDIRLDPPELGRVDVRLSIDATGKAQAHLTADQPQTLDLLQKDSAALTRALRDAGLDVSQDGLNFSLQAARTSHGDGQRQRRAARRHRSRWRPPRSSKRRRPPALFSSAGDGRLDITSEGHDP